MVELTDIMRSGGIGKIKTDSLLVSDCSVDGIDAKNAFSKMAKRSKTFTGDVNIGFGKKLVVKDGLIVDVASIRGGK